MKMKVEPQSFHWHPSSPGIVLSVLLRRTCVEDRTWRLENGFEESDILKKETKGYDFK